MNFARHKHKFIILAALALVALTSGLGCKGGSLTAQRLLEEPVQLEIWGVFDSQAAYSQLTAAYTATRPQVSIRYRKLQFEEYERALLEAWAEDRGPDIFMVHNTWVGGYLSKIQPMPPEIEVATAVTTGELKKNVTASITKYRSITPSEISNQFVDVVAQDAIRQGVVYGLPLSVDTLALYYNRALLDQAGIATVPATWQEVKEAVKKITSLDTEGQLIRSGIALGGTGNINRSFDILSFLMAQNGAGFTDPTGSRAIFAGPSPYTTDTSYKPGQEALRFYTDFASPSKEVYTWSEDLPDAQESFSSGNLAMLLGYNYQLPLLKTQGPRVNFGIGPVPHINSNGTDATGETINWANYWLLSVAQSSDHPQEAWDFIHFAATQPEQARLYLDSTKKPTALRALIPEQINDPEIGVFARQLLTARSWYQGRDAIAAEKIFQQMILGITSGQATLVEAIKLAESAVSQTLR